MFSQQELAPAEDQGVVFGVIQAAANSTVEQTTLFTQQIHDVYKSFPEAASIFQITFPTGGFGGMVSPTTHGCVMASWRPHLGT